ncbi:MULTISPECIES: methyl-accepting chemotaxis protein [unclassified Rhizobium]|uniref:methyl-accepting chemotaxis protein n=1 Tax=unclassified Rhizobium TaxID=2613769 RepID=UPI0007137CB8|nr:MULTISPECIES: PAS domain-containing methyl-accepting chemotaxis protein [unclassified Rhizobium]KQS83800.1 chemotaxis protein [Rhizobium sp. Leaf386]KQT04937.1 chemotaxis protein [Rhizobium sp. Leaf391]KQU08740.1 chemotaxis protein [Rhizobium sp. Leaf453]
MPVFGNRFRTDANAILSAMQRSQAIIEFDMQGRILTANDNFCRAMGYSLTEIVGQHHRLFVDPADAASADYQQFWARLGRGEFDSRQYRRIGKGGREIWIEASYNPIFRGGKPYKVVKFATDITTAKLKTAEDAGKIDAISRAQAVIEFAPDGKILTANANFLSTVGYELADIRGKHHSMFCEPTYAGSEEYKTLWNDLRSGKFIADEFKRIGRGGKQVWIQASYNPIFDHNGRVFKVVKFATDVTGRIQNSETLAGALEKLAAGNLDQSIGDKFIPALEKLRLAFNESAAKLKQAMRAVGQNAAAIASGSSEISNAAADLSSRTEQQAASIEETAAALEQITTTVADSSRRAEEAGKLVAQTKEDAERSSTVVNNAVAAMGQIAASSSEISNIIGVIDEIAFQTNLLALNAGVEAARAGDAGKGFAVVAQEVRELAQRSAKAAKEIKSLITASTEQVKSGVSLVGQTGKALEEILAQVQLINTNVVAIVEGAKEQATGLKEINQAVNTMDQGTQQNAAMVEQSTAASHSLAREAEALFQLLGQFKVGEAGEGRITTARQDARPVASPARAMANRVAKAFNSNVAVAANRDSWEEF